MPNSLSQTDEKGNKLMTGSWAIQYEHENGVLIREYHVDCHLEFLNMYVASEEKTGGNLSVHIPAGSCPKLLIGHDKCIIRRICFLPNSGMVWKVKM